MIFQELSNSFVGSSPLVVRVQSSGGRTLLHIEGKSVEIEKRMIP